MRVLAAQFLMSLAVLAFAVLSLLVARAIPGPERRFAGAWALTGWAFLLAGCSSLFHDVFSLVGFLGGPDSAAWAAVIRWHPILNHSRTFLLTAYCVALSVMLYRDRGRPVLPPRWRPFTAVLLGGMVLGGLVGWWEPDFTNWTHYSAVAVFDVMEMLAFMALLLVGIVAGGMDRALWYALGVNGFVLALSVLLFAAEARIGMAGQWWPHPLHVQGVKAMLHVSVIAIVLLHLRRIRRGHPVRGLMEDRVQAARVPSLHA